MATTPSECCHDNTHPEEARNRQAERACRELVDTRSYLWRELCTIARPGDKLHSAEVKGREHLTAGRHLTSQRTIG